MVSHTRWSCMALPMGSLLFSCKLESFIGKMVLSSCLENLGNVSGETMGLVQGFLWNYF